MISIFNSNTLGNLYTTGGNVGINTTRPSPTARLHIYDPLISGSNFSTCSMLIDRFNTTGSYSGCHIMLRGGYYSGNGDLTSPMPITGGNSKNDFLACLGGTNAQASWSSTDYGGIVYVIEGGGNAFNATGVWGSISDVRLKENIIDARNYLDDINKLRVVKYSMKSDKLSSPNQLGLIAQEVESVFPGLVSINKNGSIFETKGIKHSIINMMMLKSIQELSAKNDNLQSQLNTLLDKINAYN